MLEASLTRPLPAPGLPEGDRAAGPAGDTAPRGRAEDPTAAELVPDGAGAQALPTDAAGGHHHPGARGPAGRGAGVAGDTRTQPLNAPCTLRPAGGPTTSAGHWRGRRRPCSSRPRGGATGSGQPTSARDRASSASRASAGGTCSARGEQNGTEHPPANPLEHSTQSTLKRYLR